MKEFFKFDFRKIYDWTDNITKNTKYENHPIRTGIV